MEIRYLRRTFTPTTVGSDQTTALFAMKVGWRVLWASCRPVVNAAGSTNSTMSLGDGTSVAGYITTSDVDIETATAGTPINGTGTLLAQSGGKLYTVADTVDVVYTANGATGTKPKIEFTIAVIPEYRD